MSVPKYNEMYAPFLKALADGKVHTIMEVRQFIAEQMGGDRSRFVRDAA